MLIAAVVAVLILMLPIGYVLVRKLSVTRQEISFAAPQDGVKAIYLDIREDTVRSLHLLNEDGTVTEVVVSRAA
ncbi:MAG: hypothetical protein M1274_06565 [Actinobacteria bacterium]|nr:hypothetical protein [Actinomycetota bacterium]